MRIRKVTIRSCQREKVVIIHDDILGNGLVPAVTVKNLGVKLDSCLDMSKQVSDTIRVCYYHIKDLRRVRRHLTSVAITLCNALVGSKIDYCNSLYYGITNKQMQRLQGIQNTLCRIVTRTHCFSSVTGPLMSLHWLPVKYRVQFKVCLMTYKVYKNKYPAYLEDCVQPYRSIYNTRHSERCRWIAFESK